MLCFTDTFLQENGSVGQQKDENKKQL